MNDFPKADIFYGIQKTPQYYLQILSHELTPAEKKLIRKQKYKDIVVEVLWAMGLCLAGSLWLSSAIRPSKLFL